MTNSIVVKVGDRVRWAAAPGSDTSTIRTGVVTYAGSATCDVKIEQTTGVIQARVIGTRDRVMTRRLHADGTTDEQILAAERKMFHTEQKAVR